MWPEIQEQLRTNPGLEAKTIFAALQRQQPERFADGQLRTLQRKIKHWRATEGPAQEVYFVQEHHAGDVCASDFTHLTEVAITIVGQSFPHMLYHFVLTYSNWETGTICYSESFASLSEGLQNALWELGGVPLLPPYGPDDGGSEQPHRSCRFPEELPSRCCGITEWKAGGSRPDMPTRTETSNSDTIDSNGRWTRRCYCVAAAISNPWRSTRRF